MGNVIITPSGNNWAVHVGDSSEVQVFDTRSQALDYAQQQAMQLHSYVLIQNDAGELEQHASYVPDGVKNLSMDETYHPKKKRKRSKTSL